MYNFKKIDGFELEFGNEISPLLFVDGKYIFMGQEYAKDEIKTLVNDEFDKVVKQASLDKIEACVDMSWLTDTKKDEILDGENIESIVALTLFDPIYSKDKTINHENKLVRKTLAKANIGAHSEMLNDPDVNVRMTIIKNNPGLQGRFINDPHPYACAALACTTYMYHNILANHKDARVRATVLENNPSMAERMVNDNDSRIKRVVVKVKPEFAERFLHDRNPVVRLLALKMHNKDK